MDIENPPVTNYSGGFSVLFITGFPVLNDDCFYFSFISLMILLRFIANIVIAPCISMPIRPDDDATS